jgi:hypothetical protein
MLMALFDYGNKGKKSIPFLNSIYLSRRASVYIKQFFVISALHLKAYAHSHNAEVNSRASYSGSAQTLYSS